MQFPPPGPDGSFAIHRIRVPGVKSKCSAYFAADGRLIDAEFINASGHSRPVKSAKARLFLFDLGERRVATMAKITPLPPPPRPATTDLITYRSHGIWRNLATGFYQVYDGETFLTFDHIADAKACVDELVEKEEQSKHDDL